MRRSPLLAVVHGAGHNRAQGSTRVELQPGADDRPDRLLVTGANGSRSWPLPERAFHVDVDGNTAIFSTRGSREVYAVDLRKGRVALVGDPAPRQAAAGRPSASSFGTTSFKRRENEPSTLMKFIPRRHVEAALRMVSKAAPCARSRSRDLAMDGFAWRWPSPLAGRRATPSSTGTPPGTTPSRSPRMTS